MNPAMLLLSLDPKGNLMNNEHSGEMGEWGWRMSTGVGEREALQEQDTLERLREGNLLVFCHQLGHKGDMKRMEADASRGSVNQSVLAEETD